MKKNRSLISRFLLLVLLCNLCAGLISCGKQDGEPSPSDDENTIPAESVHISSDTLTLSPGGEQTLTASVLPENVTKSGVRWSSSRESVATVDENGLVKALSVGKAKIFARKAATDRCPPSVSSRIAEGEGKVIGVTLSSSFLQLKVGATASLTASVLPESAKEQTVSWESSDPSVVTVAGRRPDPFEGGDRRYHGHNGGGRKQGELQRNGDPLQRSHGRR